MLVLLLALVALHEPPRGTPIFGGLDFRQFHSGAKLLLAGENPYDEAKVWEIQQVDAYGNPHVTVSPPTTLVPYLPFGPLDYATAIHVHTLLHAVLLVVTAWLWCRFGGMRKGVPFAALLACLAWFPCLLALHFGQAAIFPSLAVSLWLLCIKSRQSFVAGAFLPIVMVKPHLGLPLLIAGLAFHTRHRQTRALLACGLVSAIGLAIPWLLRPTVYSEYLTHLPIANPTKWITATIAAAARTYWGPVGWWAGYLAAGVTWLVCGILGWRLQPQLPSAPFRVAALLALALGGSLHAFAYDFILLLPGFTLALVAWINSAPGAKLLYGWLALALFLAFSVASPWFHTWQQAVVPWLALLLIYRQLAARSSAGEGQP